jgi:hypothetical protein
VRLDPLTVSEVAPDDKTASAGAPLLDTSHAETRRLAPPPFPVSGPSVGSPSMTMDVS